MSDLILPISILLYVVLPMWMLGRGWPIRAGVAMIVAASMPWVFWFLMVPQPWGPGAGLVLMLTAGMLLLALVPIMIGVGRAIFRLSSRSSSAG